MIHRDHGSLTSRHGPNLPAQVRRAVKAKVNKLDLGSYGTVTTRDFHQVARQMSADVLRLLKGERS